MIPYIYINYYFICHGSSTVLIQRRGGYIYESLYFMWFTFSHKNEKALKYQDSVNHLLLTKHRCTSIRFDYDNNYFDLQHDK